MGETKGYSSPISQDIVGGNPTGSSGSSLG